MPGRYTAFRINIGLFAGLSLSLGGCPSNDFTGLSIMQSPSLGQSGGDVSSSSTSGAAADAAVNAGNPADRPTGSDSSGSSELSQAAAAAIQNFADCNSPRQEADWQSTIMQLVNTERGKAGLSPVTRNATLEAQAGGYACELIHYDFFDHVNPTTRSTLGQRATQFGYNYAVVGENLAAGQTTPEQAFADWMNSPGHRQNIMDPRFTELGVGIRSGGDYGLYWVQEFGKPQASR